MTKHDIEEFVEEWPPSTQLNIYLVNGFNATVVAKNDIVEVGKETVEIIDPYGNRNLIPAGHIMLMKFSALQSPEHNGKKR